MLHMRHYTQTDLARIAAWPVYPPEYAELDYALRANGWIAEFEDKPATQIYVFEQDSELIAYTILSGTSADDAEFRIALHGDYLGKGLGMEISMMTITRAFRSDDLRRLHLIVRTNNERAKRLYLNIGFVCCGVCSKITNGKQVEYLEMELLRRDYPMPQL